MKIDPINSYWYNMFAVINQLKFWKWLNAKSPHTLLSTATWTKKFFCDITTLVSITTIVEAIYYIIFNITVWLINTMQLIEMDIIKVTSHLLDWDDKTMFFSIEHCIFNKIF